jgi:hypothetical protein
MISRGENDKIVALQAASGGENESREDLPYAVELWDQQNANVERAIARASSGQLARAIFDSARKEFPERRITVRRGPETVLDSAKS